MQTRQKIFFKYLKGILIIFSICFAIEKQELKASSLNQQGQQKEIDLSRFVIDAEELQSEDNSQNIPQSVANDESNMALTGIPYLDKKIKDGTLTAYDAYLANKYLGINLANLNVKAQLKCDLKNTDIAETIKEIELMLNYLDNTDEVLKLSGLSGFNQGLQTWLNEITGGWWSLDYERAKLNTASLKVIDAIAYIINHGNITNESRKDARKIFNLGFTSQDEVVVTITMVRKQMLNYIDTLLAVLESECASS